MSRRMSLAFEVRGLPAPQGSKKHVGRGVMVESSAKVKPWRQDVKAAAEAALIASDVWPTGYDGDVACRIVFTFLRPRSHYGTGKNAGVVKASAPPRPTGHNMGDLDKLCRSTFDALVAAEVVRDDSLFYGLDTVKSWTERNAGARIEVWAA